MRSGKSIAFWNIFFTIQVALTLHGFTLHGSHFTRGLGFCQMNSHYVIHYTFSSLYTVKNIILVVLNYCVSPYTNFSLHDLFRKKKSCKVRATCMRLLFSNSNHNRSVKKPSIVQGLAIQTPTLFYLLV